MQPRLSQEQAPTAPARSSHGLGSFLLSVCVRHEGIARSVLLFQKEVTTPAVLPAVPYRGVRRRQRRGAKPSGQRILTREGGDRSASRDRDCQHRGGRGPGARGMANPGEPPQAS
jgi:hypothetical protein